MGIVELSPTVVVKGLNLGDDSWSAGPTPDQAKRACPANTLRTTRSGRLLELGSALLGPLPTATLARRFSRELPCFPSSAGAVLSGFVMGLISSEMSTGPPGLLSPWEIARTLDRILRTVWASSLGFWGGAAGALGGAVGVSNSVPAAAACGCALSVPVRPGCFAGDLARGLAGALAGWSTGDFSRGSATGFSGCLPLGGPCLALAAGFAGGFSGGWTPSAVGFARAGRLPLRTAPDGPVLGSMSRAAALLLGKGLLSSRAERRVGSDPRLALLGPGTERCLSTIGDSKVMDNPLPGCTADFAVPVVSSPVCAIPASDTGGGSLAAAGRAACGGFAGGFLRVEGWWSAPALVLVVSPPVCTIPASAGGGSLATAERAA
mmetsp:Transcript_20267/g.44958  ORF Transcript_20267/g.44958 Transcript_20267/m.44958 type:complete len:378 (-) Transcript_20267:185-1318(-)